MSMITIMSTLDTAVLLLLATATKAESVIRALFGRFITFVIQIDHGLRSTVDAFRLQEVGKPLYHSCDL